MLPETRREYDVTDLHELRVNRAGDDLVPAMDERNHRVTGRPKGHRVAGSNPVSDLLEHRQQAYGG